MAFLPKNINMNKSRVEKTLYVDLDDVKLQQLVKDYSNASYTHIIISIEPSNEFINGRYTTRFNVLVLTTLFDITVAKIIDEFKNLFAYHMQRR